MLRALCLCIYKKKFESSHGSDIITRSQSNEELVVPKPNLEIIMQFVAYQEPRIWNGLPISVRRVEILKILRTWLSLSVKHNHYLP